MAKANLTSVGREARAALVRGAPVEWRSKEISMGATMSAIAMNNEMPMEVEMEALGPVTEEGSPLKGYDRGEGVVITPSCGRGARPRRW